MRKQGIVVAAEAWLEGLMHESPAFHAQVEDRLAAINIAQDLAALRVSDRRNMRWRRVPIHACQETELLP